jgi:hypothetical protein
MGGLEEEVLRSMFNINTFQANIRNEGLLQTNRFKVTIPPPQILSGASSGGANGTRSTNDLSKLLSFRAEQFRAPGLTLLTDSVNRYGVGSKQKMVHNVNYTDTVVTFLSDGYGDIWTFWYNWINKIFNFAGNDNAGNGSPNSLPGYVAQYKENYAVKMSVTIYDVLGYETMTINLYDAYPIYINDTQLNWGDNNQLLRISVGITFKEFSIEGASVSGGQQRDQRNANNTIGGGQDLSKYLSGKRIIDIVRP